MGADTRLELGSGGGPLHAVAAVGEGLALIDLAIFRLLNLGTGGVGLDVVREDEVIFAAALILEHQIHGLLDGLAARFRGGLDHQLVVTCLEPLQRHGEGVAAVFDICTAFTLGHAAVVIEGVGDGQIALCGDGEIEGCLAVVQHIVAGQTADADAVHHRRLLLLQVNLDPLQLAVSLQIDGVHTVDRIELAIGPLLTGADQALLGVDLAGKGMGPVVLLALFGSGDGQHGLQIGALAVGIEYPGHRLVTHCEVDGGVDGACLAPLQRWLAAIFELGIDDVVEAVAGVAHFPHAEDHLITGALRQDAVVGYLLGRLHHVAVNDAEGGQIKRSTGERLVGVPVLLGEVVAPVAGDVVGGEGPADSEGAGLNFTFGPAVAGLDVQLAPARAARRGDLTILRAALREAGRALHALGFPLHAATLAVAAGFAQIVAALWLADVTMSQGAAAGQQSQHRCDVIELDFCCHTFLCSTDVGSQVGWGCPRYTLACGNPAILDKTSVDRRLCVPTFRSVCQMTR